MHLQVLVSQWHYFFPSRHWEGFLWTANEITLDPVSVGLGLAQDTMHFVLVSFLLWVLCLMALWHSWTIFNILRDQDKAPWARLPPVELTDGMADTRALAVSAKPNKRICLESSGDICYADSRKRMEKVQTTAKCRELQTRLAVTFKSFYLCHANSDKPI